MQTKTLDTKTKKSLTAFLMLGLTSVASAQVRNGVDWSKVPGWGFPNDGAERVAYCVGIFQLASTTADNPTGASLAKQWEDHAYSKVRQTKRLNGEQIDKFGEAGFKRGQLIISRIMGDFDSLNEQMKQLQVQGVIKQAVRDCTNYTKQLPGS